MCFFSQIGYCVWNFVYFLFNTLFFHSSKSLSVNITMFYLLSLSKIETSCANRAALDYQVLARTTLLGFFKGAEYYQKFRTLYNFCVTMSIKLDQSWKCKNSFSKTFTYLIKCCIMWSVISEFPWILIKALNYTTLNWHISFDLRYIYRIKPFHFTFSCISIVIVR